MLKIKHFFPFIGAGLTLAVINTTITPVSAQRVIVIDGSHSFGYSQQPPVSSFIYGSPIPTPMPVDPATGLMPRSSSYQSYPRVRQKVINDATLFNPTLINPIIQDSTLVNPVIINNSWRRTPLRRSRVIVHPAWKY